MFEPTEYTRKPLFADDIQPRNTGAGLIYGADLERGSVVASRGVATSASKAKKCGAMFTLVKGVPELGGPLLRARAKRISRMPSVLLS